MSYEFDPDKVFKAGTDIRQAGIEVGQWVTAPLRRISYPEMPSAVLGQVQSVVTSVTAMVAEAQKAVCQVGQAMRNKTYEMTDHDDPNKLPWYYTAGDVIVWGAEFTGTDIIYKTSQAVSGEGTWTDARNSAGTFAFTVLGGPIFKGVWKGGKWVVGGARGTRKANEARVAAQLARAAQGARTAPKVGDPLVAAQLERLAKSQGMSIRPPAVVPGGGASVARSGAGGIGHADDGALIGRHVGRAETYFPRLDAKKYDPTKPWPWKGGHLRSTLDANHWVTAVGRTDASGVRWIQVAHRDVITGQTSTTWKTFFPQSWSSTTVQQAASRYPAPGKHAGTHLGVPFTVVRNADGSLRTIFPTTPLARPA